MDRLTERQFTALVELTSIKPGSATHTALYRHLVLGYSRRQAIDEAGISHQSLSSGIARLTSTDAAARAYVATLAD